MKIELLSKSAQAIISKYTNTVDTDPVDCLDLNNVEAVSSFFQTPLWSIPTKEDYEILLSESEYSAWVIYNRYYLNHYTISVHDLPEPFNRLELFNEFLKSLGIELNDSGGEIKISRDCLLKQSISIANQVEAHFSGGELRSIAGSYVEFAERGVLPEFINYKKTKLKRKHRREGFEAPNADKIFESTFTSQLKK